MNSLHGLPRSLLVFLLALPALCSAALGSNASVTNNATSPYDPFRQLRLHTDIKPSDPICCLIPLTTEPLPTTAEFLSFEDWKSKQRELQAQAQAANQTPSPDTPAPDVPAGASTVASTSIIGDPDLPVPALLEPAPALSPHFRVPLTDRFNYASLDCSSRVHTSHRSARSPAAILSSKKDRYMLSPCSANPNFVVVELCDDIRIDTVQLANFEFFSGVFRDFRVSVAQTYNSDGQGWIEAGTYRAKNIRSIQSFHPLVELRPFYRYIRIDFLSHYGSEFYCPISLLRVYGLTQMEEWKWEVWQTGSENNGPQTLPDVEAAAKAHDSVTMEGVTGTMVIQVKTEIADPAAQESLSSTVHLQTAQKANTTITVSESRALQTLTHEMHAPTLPSTIKSTISEISSSPVVSSRPTTSHGTVSEISVSTTSIPAITTSGENLPNSSTSLGTSSASTSPNATSVSNVSHYASSSSMQVIVSLPSSSPTPSGESIYRTIMNRLAMLETNTTLYQKYVEEQTLQIREALRRLEEEVGRLEGISKSQQNVFSKATQELELRRRQMDEERWELLSKVNHLADEVILEKRLGIAQLCLLLTVLVFMALTRGSRAALLDGTMHRLNSFSRRRTWTSADWSRKRWLSRSRTPTPMDYAPVKKEPKEENREVTITSSSEHEKDESSSVPFPTSPRARSQTPRSPIHRPTTPRRQDISRVASEGRPTGRLRRSNSHTTPANTVLSAKRFARTAHLHEVPPPARNRDTLDDGGDPHSADESAPALGDGSPRPKRKGKELSLGTRALPGPGALSRGEESEAGSWVDTEGGSDSEPDSDNEMEETSQLIERKPNFENTRTVPLISAAPSRRMGHFAPPSPASVLG